MEDQPIPQEHEWPWNLRLSQDQRVREAHEVLRILEGVQDSCAACAEMIFPDQLACEVSFLTAPTYPIHYFHPRCYLGWGRGHADVSGAD